MKKLKLQMDDLRVDTFDVTQTEKERGTVVGEQACTCSPDIWTCNESCQVGTCEQTCANYPFAQPCTLGKPIACWE
ncbi:MAG TPA: hypothetical protein VFY65_00795 [Longimicrobium sp.]|nr:hypothetical protein [Longimicrobium sp.]